MFAFKNSQLSIALFVIVLSCDHAVGDETSDGRSSYAASILSGALLNNESIRDFDVISHLETYDDNIHGKMVYFSKKMRQVEDSESKSFLFGSVSERRNFKDESSDPESVSCMAGAFADSSPFYFSKGLGKIQKSGFDPRGAKAFVGWGNLKTVGFVGYPDIMSFRAPDVMEGVETLATAASGVRILSESDSVIQIALSGTTDQHRFQITWDIDPKTSMITKRAKKLFPSDGSPPRISSSEEIQWTSVNGMLVPEEINEASYQFHVSDKGERIPYTSYQETKFQWLRVNESKPLDQDVMSQLSTVGQIRQFVAGEDLGSLSPRR